MFYGLLNSNLLHLPVNILQFSGIQNGIQRLQFNTFPVAEIFFGFKLLFPFFYSLNDMFACLRFFKIIFTGIVPAEQPQPIAGGSSSDTAFRNIFEEFLHIPLRCPAFCVTTHPGKNIRRIGPQLFHSFRTDFFQQVDPCFGEHPSQGILNNILHRLALDQTKCNFFGQADDQPDTARIRKFLFFGSVRHRFFNIVISICSIKFKGSNGTGSSRPHDLRPKLRER